MNRIARGLGRFLIAKHATQMHSIQAIVSARTRLLALPYGDQGLLISRSFYNELGGYRQIPIMEDVDIIRRIGRHRLAVLPCDAITSASRYRRDGYFGRMARNVLCISLWFIGVAPERIEKVYR